MKTREQIEAKLKENEDLFNSSVNEYTIVDLYTAKAFIIALEWILSDDELITENSDLVKKIDYEILCHESTKIF
jgi:hypothetical protein